MGHLVGDLSSEEYRSEDPYGSHVSFGFHVIVVMLRIELPMERPTRHEPFFLSRVFSPPILTKIP